jgi:putative heme-binding domain-containing protein
MKTNAARLAALLALCLPCAAADTEVIPHRQDKPPNKPFSPQEAVQRMSVPEGFSVEVVSSEPDLVNPIAMAFDDRGRIWVTESVEYPRKSPGPGRDRIKILEDADRDGRADKVTVVADNLNIPTGVAVGYGGVWMLNAPDLLFLRERDGKEVGREVVVTGFGRADTHELPSSLTWGPDGWLYGLNGVFNPSRIRLNNGTEYEFTCAMWRVHPRTREFQVVCEGTSNPYGIAWDAEGSAIVEACHWANDHLFHFVERGYYQRQAGAYPPFTMRIGSITDHGHQKTAYCGIAFFDSGAYPEQFCGRIYVGNIHGGCVNVDRLQRDGSTYLAKAEPDLLTANDVWFMPVSLKVGPDGCLYVLDWYDRYHCYQDAGRDPDGIDRLKGRLYRVRYRETPRAPRFDLASETDERLIARLGDPNIYFRESAQRVLTERAGHASRPSSSSSVRLQLEKLVLDSTAPRPQRLHALWALVGSGSLEPGLHGKLLAHPDAAFRAWAARAAGNVGKVPPAIRDRVRGLARDSSPDVQLQVAIAARKLEGSDALPLLVDVLLHCGHDKLIPAIVWPNLHPLLEEQSARFAELVQAGPLAPALALVLPQAVDRILSSVKPDTQSIAALIRWLARQDEERTKQCLGVVSAKVNSLSPPAQAGLNKHLQPFVEEVLAASPDSALYLTTQLLATRLNLEPRNASLVRSTFVSTNQPEATRLLALDALVALQDAALLEVLPQVLEARSPRFLAQVFAALGRLSDQRLADVLLLQYSELAPEVQPLAIELIMQREPWARKLLNAVLAKKLPASVLNANQLRKILESNDREAIWAVEKAFGTIRAERNPEREKVVAEMTEYLRKNLGDARAGDKVFRLLCAQCHTIYGEGGNVGPDLTANGRASFEQLVSNVFDPSLVIGPAYQVTTVVTKDGRNLTGLITEDNDQHIVLKLPGAGIETVPHATTSNTPASASFR